MASFAIEAPAETNPFTLQALQLTLLKASSSEVNQIQSSAKQLQQWETTAGYYGALQDVFIQGTLPGDVRMLALIQLKNGIDKYWRKTANNAILPSERAAIRQKLLQSTIREPADNLASISAIVAAKIARHDFPGQWPDLFKELIELVRSTADPNLSSQHRSRILLLTHRVVKELANIRFANRARASLQSAAPSLFAALQDCYTTQLQQWQAMISTRGNELDMSTVHSMNMSEQVIKILRRLCITGWDFPHRDSDVEAFWTLSASHMQLYLNMLHQADIQHAYRLSSARHLKQISKFHLSMARVHSVSFTLFHRSVDLVTAYWTAAKELRRRQLNSPDLLDDDTSDVYDNFNLRTILLLRACFKEAFSLTQPLKYRNSDGKDETSRARKILSETLLTQDFVKELFQLIVSQFFIYVPSDVEDFASQPEEWDAKDEASEEDYEKSVRAAADRLLMDVTLHYKDIVIEPLLATVSQLSNSVGPDACLMKDAVYAAIGVSAAILYKKFDFNSFIRTNLVPDIKETDYMFGIVRRRIAILLSKWIPIDISDENLHIVYEIFQILLDKESTLNTRAVRIAAGKRLKDVVDALGFSSDAFAPYASKILLNLLDLIREVELLETKLALLNSISTLVLRMKDQVTPFATQIVGILETLWNEANNENMMKTIIVTILQKLVNAIKAESVPFHGPMLYIIRTAIEPGSESQLYMLEDALDLWIAILQNTPAPVSQDLLSLVPYLIPLYELEDAMQRSLIVTESYILLAPSEMLRDNIRKGMFAAFPPLLTVRDTKIPTRVTGNIELMIRASEAVGGQQAVQLVVNDLMQSSVLPHALDSIQASWKARQTTGPNKKDPPPDWKNETDYLVIFSRIILCSIQAFENVLAAFCQSKQITLETGMSQFLEEAFSHMDAVGRPSHSKLICLALTRLLETGQPWILGKLQDLMALWTSLIVELRDSRGDGDHEDYLIYTDEDDISQTQMFGDQRKQQLRSSDLVHTVKLSQFVSHHLRSAVAQAGGDVEFQNQWLVNVDKDVIKEFGELGIM